MCLSPTILLFLVKQHLDDVTLNSLDQNEQKWNSLRQRVTFSFFKICCEGTTLTQHRLRKKLILCLDCVKTTFVLLWRRRRCCCRCNGHFINLLHQLILSNFLTGLRVVASNTRASSLDERSSAAVMESVSVAQFSICALCTRMLKKGVCVRDVSQHAFHLNQ